MTTDEDRMFQFLIWNYAVEGDILEHDALLSENATSSRTRWDRTRKELATCLLDRGNGWERVPDWWALNYLPMKWRERQHGIYMSKKETNNEHRSPRPASRPLPESPNLRDGITPLP